MKGFTLLEVLIATVLTSFILTAVYGAYTSSIENVQSARETARLHQTARGVLEMMKREIQCAAGDDQRYMKGEARNLDDTHADRIELVTTASHAADVGVSTGLYRVAYEMVRDPDGAGYVLYRTQESLSGESSVASSSSYQLARGVRGLRLSYESEKGKVKESWGGAGKTASKSLPQLVRVSLTLKTGSGRERTFSTAVHPELAESPR